jgi:general secretion pathway protein E
LVLSTLHTNTAAGAIIRLQDMGVEPYLITSSVNGVLSQRLVRRLCQHCKEAYVPEPQVVKEAGMDRLGLSAPKLWRAVGCPQCRHNPLCRTVHPSGHGICRHNPRPTIKQLHDMGTCVNLLP